MPPTWYARLWRRAQTSLVFELCSLPPRSKRSPTHTWSGVTRSDSEPALDVLQALVSFQLTKLSDLVKDLSLPAQWSPSFQEPTRVSKPIHPFRGFINGVKKLGETDTQLRVSPTLTR
jgi:hypothetical protein